MGLQTRTPGVGCHFLSQEDNIISILGASAKLDDIKNIYGLKMVLVFVNVHFNQEEAG